MPRSRRSSFFVEDLYYFELHVITYNNCSCRI